ncbi:M-phase phosphoprotein 6 [Phymastichus coffea]|uniref:M-phase phosphoprotein 6 n=1 Tax=Phymastichus coffea TaxID=108790 RepID=UPI00273B4831|nr:M-phase phosphoprotein 6 [Phymastichus coffea]
MAWKDTSKHSLSKSILEMKFMKRTKDKVEKEAFQQEGEEYFGKQTLPKKSGRFITEASYAFCEELIEGRLSFQGENPELERLLELEHLAKVPKEERDMDADVSDTQMTKILKSTTKINVTNMKHKSYNSQFDSNVEPQRKKLKFLKPVE